MEESEQNSRKIIGSPRSLSVTFGIMCISSPKETLHVEDLRTVRSFASYQLKVACFSGVRPLHSLVLLYTLLFYPENEDNRVFQNGGRSMSASVSSRFKKFLYNIKLNTSFVTCCYIYAEYFCLMCERKYVPTVKPHVYRLLPCLPVRIRM